MMMMIYQTKFYTDIFGLEGAVAGTVMLVARIVDAFVDPTVGVLSDRTQTRFGNTAHGYCGQPCRLWYFMYWHSTILASKTKLW